eukprot:COSAG01_NODE_56818_length_316_cov_0.705069_1_plen_81_part_10
MLAHCRTDSGGVSKLWLGENSPPPPRRADRRLPVGRDGQNTHTSERQRKSERAHCQSAARGLIDAIDVIIDQSAEQAQPPP